MIVKKLKEIYNVDTISQDKGWKKVAKAIEEMQQTTDEDIMIDFSSTNVVDPWNSAEFRQLIRNEKLHMKFVNSEKVVNNIKMMCVIEGVKADRIINEIVEVPREKTAEERKIEQYGKMIIPYFKEDENGNMVFNVREKYDQLQSTNTVGYIKYAINEINKEKGKTEFIIVFNKIIVLSNVLSVFAQLIVELEASGIHLKIDVDTKEAKDELGLYIHIATNNKYTAKERAKAFKEMAENTPGMLIKYKKSKATDDFGRQGKGEVVSSRIAILNYIKEDGGTPVAVVTSYNSRNFYTKQHWMVEHDNDKPTGLHEEVEEFAMEEIGLGDKFLGSRAHFILPIQQNKDESKTLIIDIDDEGKNIKKVCTIPERMKVVFDDWGVKYDEASLNKAIEDTKAQLSDM